MSRPRKTKEQHKRQGTFRPDRHAGRELEPEYSGAPVRPKGLSAEAGRHWDLVVPPLVAAGVAKAIDASALVALCEAWAEYRGARRIKTYDLKSKRQRQMLINGFLRTWRDLAARFGLTPADRAKLEATPDGEEKNPFDEFMRRQFEGKAAGN